LRPRLPKTFLEIAQIMPGERTTIRELARLSGVSVGTVSRALNGYTDVRPETREHLTAGRRREERHHVARAHDDLEGLGDARCRQVQLGQVAGEPSSRRIQLGRLGDQYRIHIHADHVVAQRGQVPPDPALAAAGVEDT